MKAQRLEMVPTAAATARRSAPPAAGVLAQRHSTLGGGSVTAPPLLDAGRPLEPATRQSMERGFGTDFGAIRIHDDARAHDNARSLGAIAYAAGNDIVFGEGRYRPETPSGRALIAHELAHSIQQGGVQMKADGPLPVGADQRLEAEADRAALDVTGGRTAPSLTRVAAPAIFRAEGDVPSGETTDTPSAETSEPATVPAWPEVKKTEEGAPAPDLPKMKILKEDAPGPGATALVLESEEHLTLPPKGSGKWVQARYQAAAEGGSLIYDPVFHGGSVAAVMEKSPDYKKAWLGNFGFTTLQAVAEAIRNTGKADPDVQKDIDAHPGIATILGAFDKESLAEAQCDIDHIVEKQLKGGSNASNLQLLTAETNRLSGTLTAAKLSDIAKSVRAVRPKLVKLQLHFPKVTVPGGDEDASVKIENLLRSGKIKGDAAIKQREGGAPVALLAGGKQEVVSVKAAGTTPIDFGAKRLISGLMLTHYSREAAGDKVKAKVSSKPMIPSEKPVVLDAARAAAPTGTVKPEEAPSGAAGAANAAIAAAAGEYRELKLNKALNKDLEIYYPYLSRGKLTSLAVDENGGLTGTGVISPRVKFLGDLKFSFAPDSMKLEAPLDVSKFKSPIALIRFTGGSVALELAPTLKPEGTINFEIGPAAKPLMLGEVKATTEGGAFVATGTLRPGMALPGISEASGVVRYHSEAGWSGKLSAKSAGKLPNSTVEAELGFTEEAGKFIPYAKGGMTTQVRDKTLKMGIAWAEKTGIVYSGGFNWPKPFPIVDAVDVKGTYSASELNLQGTSDFTFRQWTGSLQVFYRQKDGEAGKLWGSGSVAVETKNKKGKGKLGVKVSEAGELTGSGEIAYQLTDKIKPLLGVTLSAGGHVRINGAVELGTIELFGKWPEADKGKRTLMSANPSFKIPTPVPALNAAVNIHASVGISYSIGPGQIRKVVLAGAFDPLEENPNVTASLKGEFVIPTKFSLYGEFGAEIGAEIAGGLAGIAGGLEVVPQISLGADAIAAFDAKYDKGEFSFDGRAYLEAQLRAKLGINLTATVYGLYHALEYRWRYPVAAVEKQLGPSIVINVGKVSYSTAKGVTLPSLSDISIEPKDLDPLAMVKQLLSEKNEKETTK
ncbi:MAG TPA: DUF4157 domain-containing protein [Allosphingosinicella sp.]|jgi:hypothetical protein